MKPNKQRLVGPLATFLCTVAALARLAVARPDAVQASFTIELSNEEYSLLHAAIFSGVKHYGGDASFAMRLARQGESLSWALTIENLLLIDAMRLWTAEKSVELLKIVNLEAMTDTERSAVKTMQSLNIKIAQSLANPIWPTMTVTDVCEQDGPDYFVGHGPRRHRLVGPRAQAAQAVVGNDVIVNGTAQPDRTLVVNWLRPVRQETLEVVVTSHCVHGLALLRAVYAAMQASSEGPPEVHVVPRYLFFRTTSDQSSQQQPGQPVPPTWTSIHGQAEVDENLLQMVIRDLFPENFKQYFLSRAENADTAWVEAAKRAGLSDSDVQHVIQKIASERDSMIEAEFEYVSNTLQTTDGSPTIFWESQRIDHIAQVPAFRRLEVGSSKCESKQTGAPTQP